MTNDSETTGEDVCACRHLRAKHDYGHGECYLSGCKCRTFEKAHTPTGYRAILIQKAREHADDYRRYDDTEGLVGTLVAMANMLASLPEPQGEPSAEAVKAFLLEEWRHEDWGYYGDDDPPHCACGDRLEVDGDGPVVALDNHRVRAALRAAAAVREEGEKR